MVNKRSLLSTALAAGLALVLVACSGGSDTAGSATPSATTASSTPPSPTPSSTPSATSTASTPVAAKPRTKAELTKALLALTDLPAGFAIDPDTSDDGSRLTSKEARCKGVVSVFNTQTAPGSKASVTRLFSGGQQGPFVQETLDAMGSPQAATALISRTRAAVRSCSQAKLTIPGAGTSTVRISELSAPTQGTSPMAVRFAASSGPLAGFELIFVITGLSDVVLGMSFDAPDDLEAATADAYDKAAKVLGTTKTGT
jgi:hypothetical protein